MASEFTGTNSEKIDTLVSDVVEIRTTLRLVAAVLALMIPILISLAVWIISSIHSMRLEIVLSDEAAPPRE